MSNGDLTIGFEQFDKNDPLRGAVLSLRAQGNLLYETSTGIARRYNCSTKGFWYRLEAPPLRPGAEEVIDIAAQQYPRVLHEWELIPGGYRSVTALVFREEQRQNTFRDGWLFVVRIRDKNCGQLAYFARAGRAGQVDLQTRVPELSSFPEKTVSVAGLGCIGAAAAVQFARAGLGNIRLLDPDIVDPGTTVRWPFGLSASGRAKVEVIARFLSLDYPFTKVDGRVNAIGRVDSPDVQNLPWLCDGSDLLFDATVESGVNHLLSELARERKIPYVYIAATNGGWGGMVICIRPERTAGCWMCAQHALEDGTITPPPESEPFIQPYGCADPTFTGANFDTDEIPLMGVRMATAALNPSYPSPDWDVAVLAMRAEDGHLVAPQWKTYRLDRHAECQNH